jgi:hypothetical protein
MKFEITIQNTENIGTLTPEKIRSFEEIFSALITSGGLTGVRGGKTVIHFDAEGIFQAVQLDYMPWRRRKQ